MKVLLDRQADGASFQALHQQLFFSSWKIALYSDIVPPPPIFWLELFSEISSLL